MSYDRAIVFCKQYNNSQNVLFMMETNDFRYDTEDYEHVAFVTRQEKFSGEYDTHVKPSYTVTADDGNKYNVYSDWSAKRAARPAVDPDFRIDDPNGDRHVQYTDWDFRG